MIKIKTNCLCAGLLAVVIAAIGCGGGGGASAASSAAQPILSVYSPSVDFGDVATGSTRSLENTFFNIGTANLTLQQNSVSGPGFTASGIGSVVTLAPGQQVTLQVNFGPTGTGNANGMVSLTSSTSSMPVNIPLSGVGVDANHSAALAWTASPSSVLGYYIYRSSDSGMTWTKLNSLPDPTTFYTDWDAQGGQSYLYAITAIGTSDIESVFSNLTPAAVPSP